MDHLRHLQFSTNGAAGGVFLGQPEEGSGNGTTSSSSADSGDGNSSNSPPVAVLGVIVVLVLIAAILTLACVTWGFSYVMDHYCCCFPWFRTLDFTVQLDRSPLARRAHLYGLTLPERRRILQEYIFGQTITFTMNITKPDSINNRDTSNHMGGNDNDDDDDEEVRNNPTDPVGDLVASNQTTRGQCEPDGTVVPDDESSSNQEHDNEQNDRVRDDADHERLCCICLAEYQPGERLLQGRVCHHLFHYSCSMDWLMRPADHCPYCRRGFVTTADFRRAAMECLGVKRVEEMGAGMMGLEMTRTTSTSATTNRGETGAAMSSSSSNQPGTQQNTALSAAQEDHNATNNSSIPEQVEEDPSAPQSA